MKIRQRQDQQLKLELTNDEISLFVNSINETRECLSSSSLVEKVGIDRKGLEAIDRVLRNVLGYLQARDSQRAISANSFLGPAEGDAGPVTRIEISSDKTPLLVIPIAELKILIACVDQTLTCVEAWELHPRTGYSIDEFVNFRAQLTDLITNK